MTEPIHTWPAGFHRIVAGGFRLRFVSLTSQRLFSRLVSPYGPVGAYFSASLTLPPLPDRPGATQAATWRELSGLIARAQGQRGLFRLYDPSRCWPGHDLDVATTSENWSDGTGFSDGTGWISGYLPPYVALDEAAARGADSIVLKSLPASTARVLRMGDRFEIRPAGVPARHGHYYEVTYDAKTDANGKTRIAFQPGLRAGVAAGDMVVLRFATTVMRLASDEQGEIDIDVLHHGRAGLTFVEVPAGPAE